MIDIHAHLLPGIDDGPSDWSESLAMIEAGYRDGIRGAVCTSHVLNRLDEKMDAKLTEAFGHLQGLVREKQMRMELWLGSELHVNASFNPGCRTASIAGNGKYYLLELPLNGIPNDVDDRMFQFTLQGYKPVLAHPERNSVIVQHPETAYSLVQRGVLMQMNAGSLTGQFGRGIRKRAEEMLDHNLVHFVGSDCHNPKGRPMALHKAYKIVALRRGKEAAEKLFLDNPRNAIRGDEVWTPDPIPFDRKKRGFRFFGG
jgi:protein-tyrosine phosphatase